MGYINVYKGVLNGEILLVATESKKNELAKSLGSTMWMCRNLTCVASDVETRIALSNMERPLVKRGAQWVEYEINR